MKNFFLLSLFVISAVNTHAQVTSLNENFNSYCAVLGENYPTYWTEYDIYADPLIAWTCGPTDGRGETPGTTTPGIKCSNTDGSSYFTDTAWLFTPALNLSFYSGSIYLQFDTRYLNDAGRLSVMVSNNYQAGWPPDTLLPEHTWYDLTSLATPVLGNIGTSSWVTHSIDLTPYKNAPLYVAFRYTSNATGSSTWLIDNVLTTQTPVTGVPVIEKNTVSLHVIGNSTPSEVSLSYSVSEAATYQLAIYDMTGRIAYKQAMAAQPGTNTYMINDLDLHPGMYLVKMDNGTAYATAKAIIW